MNEASKIIEGIIKRGIEWYDYTKLDKGAWHEYRNEALRIAKSETFNNEINHYITDLMKFMAYESKDFDQILHTRTAITVLETLLERLSSIEDPEVKESKENIHEAI